VLYVGNEHLGEYHPFGPFFQEQRAHFALWALLKSPLMIGHDLRRLNDTSLALIKKKVGGGEGRLAAPGALTASAAAAGPSTHPRWECGTAPAAPRTNPALTAVTAPGFPDRAQEIIALNQDPLGVPGDLVWQQGTRKVFAAPLAGGSRGVVLFNQQTTQSQYPLSNVTVFWEQIGLVPTQAARVRDLYLGEGCPCYVPSAARAAG
jgi:hypothetical protein